MRARYPNRGRRHRCGRSGNSALSEGGAKRARYVRREGEEVNQLGERDVGQIVVRRRRAFVQDES